MEATRNPLLALGVTGCIGAYKAAEILRRLQDHGIEVQPILTEAAQHFITPYLLQTLAGRRAITGLWDESEQVEVGHISLSDQIALLLVAPATADIIAKFANGIADDFLSTFYLSVDRPVIVAPAMNTKMWRHPATVENVARLKDRGVTFVEPGIGYLACGWEGEGRLAAVSQIVDAARYALRGADSLAGRKVLISGGPTAEAIDPMRFISNRSSGRMAYALAWEARARGAEVVLVSGPVSLSPPWGVTVRHVRTAEEMKAAIERDLPGTDVVIMAAAVVDFRPPVPAEKKIKKTGGRLQLELETTPDILGWLGEMEQRPFLVGFAAESENLRENALEKLKRKGADMIIANPVSGVSDVLGEKETEGLILGSDGTEEEVKRCDKEEMARKILNEIERRISK